MRLFPMFLHTGEEMITDAHVVAAIQESDFRRRKRRRLVRRYMRLSEEERASVRSQLSQKAAVAGVVGPNIDFDAIIEFLTQLLPIIVELIGLFG